MITDNYLYNDIYSRATEKVAYFIKEGMKPAMREALKAYRSAGSAKELNAIKDGLKLLDQRTLDKVRLRELDRSLKFKDTMKSIGKPLTALTNDEQKLLKQQGFNLNKADKYMDLADSYNTRLDAERGKHWGITNFFRDAFGANNRAARSALNNDTNAFNKERMNAIMDPGNKSLEAEAIRNASRANKAMDELEMLKRSLSAAESAGAGGNGFVNNSPWWDSNKGFFYNVFNAADKAVTNGTIERWNRGLGNWGNVLGMAAPVAGMGYAGIQNALAERNRSIMDDPAFRAIAMGGAGLGLGLGGISLYNRYRRNQEDQNQNQNPNPNRNLSAPYGYPQAYPRR